MADRAQLSSTLLDAHHDLGPDNERRLSQLRRALQLSPRFTLMLVIVEGRRERTEVLRRLRAWQGDGGVPALEIAPLTAEALEVEHPHGLVVVEPEASPDVVTALRGALDDARAAGDLGLGASARLGLGYTLAALGDRSAAIAELRMAIPELRDLADVDGVRIAEQELAALNAAPVPS